MYNKKRFIKLLSAGMLVCVAVTSAQAANDNIHLQYTVPKVEASFVFFDDFDVENPEKMMGSFMKNMMDASNQGNQGNQGSKGDNPGKQMFQTILKLGAEQIQKGQKGSKKTQSQMKMSQMKTSHMKMSQMKMSHMKQAMLLVKEQKSHLKRA